MAEALRAAIRLAHPAPVGGAAFTLDVALEFPPGITCVMGASGSGKSTLLAVLAGLARPDAGTVALGDEVWLDRARGVEVPVHRRRVGYLFQGLALFPHLSALHNVTYGLASLPHAARRARGHELLRRLGVEHLAERRPRTFSGGEAQRVALARALAPSPRALLLDEPFSALDRGLRAQLAALVRALVRELDVPLVHVTHSVGEARLLADQVVRLERGQVVARGPAAAVLDPAALGDGLD